MMNMQNVQNVQVRRMAATGYFATNEAAETWDDHLHLEDMAAKEGRFLWGGYRREIIYSNEAQWHALPVEARQWMDDDGKVHQFAAHVRAIVDTLPDVFGDRRPRYRPGTNVVSYYA